MLNVVHSTQDTNNMIKLQDVKSIKKVANKI